MRAILRPAGVLLCGVITACAAGGPSVSPSPAESVATARPTATLVPTPSPTPTPTHAATLEPTPPPPPPTIDTGFLNYGQWADVLVTNLRVRTGHELDAPIIATVQPGDRLFPIDGGVKDKDLLYYWYYVAYRASVNANGHVVAEGLGWVSGGPTGLPGPPGPTYINWAESYCPSLPIDDHMREHMTEWAFGTCGLRNPSSD